MGRSRVWNKILMESLFSVDFGANTIKRHLAAREMERKKGKLERKRYKKNVREKMRTLKIKAGEREGGEERKIDIQEEKK